MESKIEYIILPKSVLEEYIKAHKKLIADLNRVSYNKGCLDAYKSILASSKPLTPVIEHAFYSGMSSSVNNTNDDGETNFGKIQKDKEEYIKQFTL